MRLRVITPVITRELARGDEYVRYVRPGTEITEVQLDKGPASIESEVDEALSIPDILVKVVEGENEGVDAVIINCMADPGVRASRELVSIPVIGPAEASMHLAATLGHKFSIVTTLRRVVPLIENEAKVYGVTDKLASIRWANIPVLDLHKDKSRLIEALTAQSLKAIEDDGAHVIVFGCTGMMGLTDAVRTVLRSQGYDGVPVIDPVVAAIRLAEALVELGLSHSKLTYPYPMEKPIVGYRVPGRSSSMKR